MSSKSTHPNEYLYSSVAFRMLNLREKEMKYEEELD